MQVDLDSVIDRLLEGESTVAIPFRPSPPTTQTLCRTSQAPLRLFFGPISRSFRGKIGDTAAIRCLFQLYRRAEGALNYMLTKPSQPLLLLYPPPSFFFSPFITAHVKMVTAR